MNAGIPESEVFIGSCTDALINIPETIAQQVTEHDFRYGEDNEFIGMYHLLKYLPIRGIMRLQSRCVDTCLLALEISQTPKSTRPL